VADVRTLAFVVAATVLAAVAAACGAGRDEDATVATTTVGEAAAPSEPGRSTAPAIEGVSLDGDSISLDDFRGRPVLINVWSSW
jgi:cytochrome oxidase Cu insertion factor (SCO1/SenC/PrrC family)